VTDRRSSIRFEIVGRLARDVMGEIARLVPVLPVPSPIVTLADVRTLRVRVDVDESDIGGLRTGQAAWVTADAYGSRRFAGRVVRVGEMLGRARIRTDDPAERIDHKVLETLIELEASARLPIGLRVDAFITRVN
jgi:multidrug efflux pump subunit AcrA (membrane-fusion protein)